MKQVIRRSIFETNSSSSHSVSKQKGTLQESYLSVRKDNKIHVEFGEFDWGYERISDQYGKLQYLCTMAACNNIDHVTIEDFLNNDDFKELSYVIGEYCGCDGINFESQNNLTVENNWVNTPKCIDFNGYIDHQSMFPSFSEFLHDFGFDEDNDKTNILNFVFNDGVTLIIDNDNY